MKGRLDLKPQPRPVPEEARRIEAQRQGNAEIFELLVALTRRKSAGRSRTSEVYYPVSSCCHRLAPWVCSATGSGASMSFPWIRRCHSSSSWDRGISDVTTPCSRARNSTSCSCNTRRSRSRSSRGSGSGWCESGGSRRKRHRYCTRSSDSYHLRLSTGASTVSVPICRFISSIRGWLCLETASLRVA